MVGEHFTYSTTVAWTGNRDKGTCVHAMGGSAKLSSGTMRLSAALSIEPILGRSRRNAGPVIGSYPYSRVVRFRAKFIRRCRFGIVPSNSWVEA